MNIVTTTTREYRKQFADVISEQFQSIRGNTIRISLDEIKQLLSGDQTMVIYETSGNNLKDILVEVQNYSQDSAINLTKAKSLLISLTFHYHEHDICMESLSYLDDFLSHYKDIKLAWGFSLEKEGHGVGLVLWSFFN